MIDIRPDYRRIVDSILERRLPDREVRAFGSRVAGASKTYSDLDLVVMGREKLSSNVLYGLRDDFEESELPFRIDILDWNRLSPEFKTAIFSHSEVLRPSPDDGRR